MAVGEVLHSPAEMRAVDAEHRGTLADGGREEEDFLIGQIPLQAVHQIQFCPDRPGGTGRRRRHSLDDELGRPREIRLVHHILMTFRMNDHLAVRKLLPEIVDMDGLKHLVHAAVALPENQLCPLDCFASIAAVGLKRIPDNHLLARQPHLIGRIAAQMLVGEEENLLASGPTPFNDRSGIGRRAGNPAVLTAKGFKNCGGVHIDRRHDGLFHRQDAPQGFPALIDLLDRRHIRHGATGSHVRKNHRLLRTAQDIRGLRHKMDAAEHNIGSLGTLRSQLRQQQRIAAKISMLNDFVPLVVMPEDHDPITQDALRLGCSAEKFLVRKSLVVGNRSGNRRSCFHTYLSNNSENWILR